MFFILLLLLNCGGSGGSSLSALQENKISPKGDAGTVFPNGEGIRMLSISPEATVKSSTPGFGVTVTVEGELTEKEKKDLANSLAIYSSEQRKLKFDDSSLYLEYIIDEDGSVQRNTNRSTVPLENVETEGSTSTLISTTQENYTEKLNINQKGIIDNIPYFTLSQEIIVDEGNKMVYDENDGDMIVSSEDPRKGATKVTFESNVKFILLNIDNENDLPTNESIRADQNIIEENTEFRDIKIITKDGDTINSSSNEVAIVKEAIKQLANKIISTNIGDESDDNAAVGEISFINMDKWRLEGSFDIKRYFEKSVAFSNIYKDETLPPLTILDIDNWHSTSGGKSLHTIRILSEKGIKVEEGSLELSDDNTSYKIIEATIVSDIAK
jgi:hypothetical protein